MKATLAYQHIGEDFQNRFQSSDTIAGFPPYLAAFNYAMLNAFSTPLPIIPFGGEGAIFYGRIRDDFESEGWFGNHTVI